MLAIINGIDQTSQVLQQTIERDEKLGDPVTTALFDVYDAGSAITITPFSGEIILIDETGVANPAWNLLLNPSLLSNDSGKYFTNSGGGFAGNLSFAGAPPVTMTITGGSGSAFGEFVQQLQNGVIVPGMQYCLSAYLNITTPMTNSNASIYFQFLDGANNVLATFTTAGYATTSGTTRIATSTSAGYGVAPAGAVTAQIHLNVSQSGGTPNGTAFFSTLQFEPMWFVNEGVSYPTPDNNPAQSTSYQIPNGTTIRQTRWFAGQVQKTTRAYAFDGQAAGKNRTHRLTCISPEWMLESTFLVNKSYTNQYDDQIITDILANVLVVPGTATGLTGTNVPLLSGHNVIRGTLVDQISWDGISVREALNALANMSGNVFYVDYNYDLHYTPTTSNVVSFGLTDGQPSSAPPPQYAIYEFSIDDDGSQLRNRVQVNGGNYDQQTSDSFTGTGAQTVFTLNNQPSSMISITVGGVAQVFKPHGQGTLGVGGLQVQWDKTTSQMTFNAAPGNGASVVATYITSLPARVRTWELQSISGHNGVTFDAKIEDTQLTTPLAAVQRGEAELASYANDLITLHFKTNQPVNAGMVVPITSSLENLSNAPYVIQSVKATIIKGPGEATGIFEYACDAGAYTPDLIALLSNTHKALNRSKKIAGLPLLQEYLVFRDRLTLNESYSVHV